MIYKRTLCFLLIIAMMLSVACTKTDDNGGTSSNIDDEDSITVESGTSSDETSEDMSISMESSEDELSAELSAEESMEESSYSFESSEEISEEVSKEISSDDVSQDSEPNLEDSFVIYAPDIEYGLEWESDGLELYNTEFRMSEALAKKFKNQINSFANAQSIMLIELDTNMAFAYSKDTKIATASSIKGPVGLYVNKCIDAGLITWDTYKTYQPRHFQEHSTGQVQNFSYGTAFSVETLMDYMIRISDNQAYLMLKELVGAKNFNYMMETLGCSQIIPDGSNWGYITAEEMASAWREIYYYSLTCESGAGLFDRYMHAAYNYIWRSIPQYEAAHKSGWSGKAFNDAGVVFADGHEYVLVVLCGRSGVDDPRSQIQFTAITKLLAELMVEYNAYKVEMGL